MAVLVFNKRGGKFLWKEKKKKSLISFMRRRVGLRTAGSRRNTGLHIVPSSILLDTYIHHMCSGFYGNETRGLGGNFYSYFHAHRPPHVGELEAERLHFSGVDRQRYKVHLYFSLLLFTVQSVNLLISAEKPPRGKLAIYDIGLY